MDQQFDTTETTSAPEVPETAPAQKKSSMMKPLIALIVGIMVAGGGYFAYDYLNTPVVAVVNGTKITEAELKENVDMMTKSAEMQGANVSDETVAAEIRSQALTNLINNEILMGAAQRAGMSTNEAAVKTAYDSLVSEVGGEEELKTRMETVGLSSETLMGNISDRLMVDEYIEAETDIENITITDEEIETYLASVNTEGVTLPPLEEIRPQIEATLIMEKQQAMVDALIEKLRGEATIEIKE